MEPGGSHGLQNRSRPDCVGLGGFDSHALPPLTRCLKIADAETHTNDPRVNAARARFRRRARRAARYGATGARCLGAICRHAEGADLTAPRILLFLSHTRL